MRGFQVKDAPGGRWFFHHEKMNEPEGPDLGSRTLSGEVPSHKNRIARLKQKVDEVKGVPAKQGVHLIP